MVVIAPPLLFLMAVPSITMFAAFAMQTEILEDLVPKKEDKHPAYHPHDPSYHTRHVVHHIKHPAYHHPKHPRPTYGHHHSQLHHNENLPPAVLEALQAPPAAARNVRKTRDADGGHHQHGAGQGDNPGPHSDQFCVDISSYGRVGWVELQTNPDTLEPYMTCQTPFVKECADKEEKVCSEVMETKCEVQPFTECAMSTVQIEYQETVLIAKQFAEKKCVMVKDHVNHQKMFPECKNVTKQNCETLWETDANGRQVWAGKENCEPVTWQECKLVPRDVKFIIPKVECESLEPIWYHEPVLVNKTKSANVMTCLVKNTSHCTPHVRHDCKMIAYQECTEVPKMSCEHTHLHKPMQEKQHRKKCLLPDEPAPPSYLPPPPSQEPMYGTNGQPSHNLADVVNPREARQHRQGRRRFTRQLNLKELEEINKNKILNPRDYHLVYKSDKE